MTGQDKKGIVPFGKGTFTRDCVLEQLAGLTLPTAVIVGEEDASTPPEYAQRIVKAIPDAKMYTVPSAGHFAILEKPAVVNETMQDFFTNAVRV